MRTHSYADLLVGLEQTDQWLDRLGIAVKADRIHRAIAALRRAEQGWRQFRATGQPTVFGKSPGLYFELVEALEFYDISAAFKSESDERIRPKLLRMLSGPPLPSAESPKNSDGRNIAFELALAAGWRLSGAKVDVGEPDVTLWLQDVPFLAECKRPFREESIRCNMRDCAEQLAAKLDEEPNRAAFGIVAISVSRILNPGNRMFVAPDEKSGTHKLSDEVEAILRRELNGFQRRELHPRITAVLFHGITPGDLGGKLVRMAASVLAPVAVGPAFLVLEKNLPRLY